MATKSIYDEIKTAEEIINKIKGDGLSMQDEDICRVADILGHSTMEQLKKVANDDTETFYWTLFHVWNWRDAVDFWNRYTNRNTAELGTLQSEYTQAKSAIKSLEEQLAIAKTNAQTECDQYFKELRRANRLQEELHDKDQEICRLKAKLYDLMEEQGGK